MSLTYDISAVICGHIRATFINYLMFKFYPKLTSCYSRNVIHPVGLNLFLCCYVWCMCSPQWVCGGGGDIFLHVVVLPVWSVISDEQTQLLCGLLPRLRRRFLKAGQWGPHGEKESRKTCPTNTTNNRWRSLSSASVKVRLWNQGVSAE